MCTSFEPHSSCRRRESSIIASCCKGYLSLLLHHNHNAYLSRLAVQYHPMHRRSQRLEIKFQNQLPETHVGVGVGRDFPWERVWRACKRCNNWIAIERGSCSVIAIRSCSVIAMVFVILPQCRRVVGSRGAWLILNKKVDQTCSLGTTPVPKCLSSSVEDNCTWEKKEDLVLVDIMFIVLWQRTMPRCCGVLGHFDNKVG